MGTDILFTPLTFRNLSFKNRIARSNISGRFDNYNGSGTQARLNFEEKFARGGAGAILSAHAPVSVRGRIFPNSGAVDCDERIPFWHAVAERMHRYDCKYILQISHAGRQRDVPGIENWGQPGSSSTNRSDPIHGFPCRAMTVEEIQQVVSLFAAGARRAREAGLDGVELHAAHGYLITQFLSSGINDRTDEYGGSLENRARFLLDIVRAIRREVGPDYHLQAKVSAVDFNDAMFPWEKSGNTLQDTVQVCQWLEREGVDALHISVGSFYSHPMNPTGPLPDDTVVRAYTAMIPSGSHTFRNYIFYRYKLLRPIMKFLWDRLKKNEPLEGPTIPYAKAIKSKVRIPVLCNGGFQTASVIAKGIEDSSFDGVSIARPLIANPDLVQIFRSGRDAPENPCTYCNKCHFGALDSPLACYELSRFNNDYDAMINEAMSVYYPTGFETAGNAT